MTGRHRHAHEPGPSEVRWQPVISGEALVASGVALIVLGGVVTVFTPLALLGVVIGVCLGAAGLDVLA